MLITNRITCSNSTITSCTVPPSERRRRALARCSGAPPRPPRGGRPRCGRARRTSRSSSPSDDTTAAWLTPGTPATKFDTSQLRLRASELSWITAVLRCGAVGVSALAGGVGRAHATVTLAALVAAEQVVRRARGAGARRRRTIRPRPAGASGACPGPVTSARWCRRAAVVGVPVPVAVAVCRRRHPARELVVGGARRVGPWASAEAALREAALRVPAAARWSAWPRRAAT